MRSAVTPVGSPCLIIINDATQGVPQCSPSTPGNADRYPSMIDVRGKGAVTNVTVNHY